MVDVLKRIARLRVPLGFLSGVLVLWLARPTGRSIAVGAAIALIGEALRVWAAGHLNKSREVTTSGPYRWLAHPLYVGSSIMGAGLALASASWFVFVVIAAYLTVTVGAAVKSEEAFLRQAFGDRYDSYRSRAGGPGDDDTRSFDPARAIANREYRAIVGLALAVLLLVLKATYNGTFWRSAG